MTLVCFSSTQRLSTRRRRARPAPPAGRGRAVPTCAPFNFIRFYLDAFWIGGVAFRVYRAVKTDLSRRVLPVVLNICATALWLSGHRIRAAMHAVLPAFSGEGRAECEIKRTVALVCVRLSCRRDRKSV